MSHAAAVRWLVLALALIGLTTLYARPLATGFLNDDYLFLEAAQRQSLSASLTSLDPLGNYFRPISRQIYFESLGRIAGERPLAYHAFNYALFLAALALLFDLLRAFLPLPGVLAGLLYFALLPFQRVNLTWVSCAQDLLALALSLAAVALVRRRRHLWAALAYLLAIFSKESALPLPLLLAWWPAESPEPAHRGRTLAPFAAAAAGWTLVTLLVRRGHPGSWLHFRPDYFLAAWIHELQSLLGLDDPAGLPASLARNGPAPLPLLCFAAVALLFGRPGDAPAASNGRPWLRFGMLWLLAFGFVTGPVAGMWSSYYYTLAAVGAALLVGLACRRIGTAGWLVMVAGLLWWHAAGSGIRAFAIADTPWVWTTHLSSFYFQRAAALTDTLGRQLRRLEPAPSPRTRFFFATLPYWAGFQMGNGAQVRSLYREPTLESFFYSQFSDSTADRRPCGFYYWDGAALGRLYGPGTDVFFQVGSDQLVFGNLHGARLAFLRGIEAGENPVDHYYWLGWTELWLGNRAAAERAWSSFGAYDDSLRWWIRMRAARSALLERRDTLDARRELAMAIRSGIGRPEAHAVLGELLLTEHPKYGLLELGIAARLNPKDYWARRGIVLGLVYVQIDERARAELETLKKIQPRWQQDAQLAEAIATLERRSSRAHPVARF